MKNVVEYPSRRDLSLVSKDSQEWLAPIPFEEIQLPEFNTDIYPSWIKNYIEGVAVATQTSVDASAVLLISILSTILTKKGCVQVRNDWIEPLNTYAIVALGSGNRKSGIYKLVTSPINDYVHELKKELERNSQERDVTINAKTERLKVLNRQYANGEDDKLNEIQKLNVKINNIKPNKLPKFSTNDVTVEQLGILLAENDERMAILSADGGGAFHSIAGRYNKGNYDADMDLYLKAYSGDGVDIERVTRETIHLTEPHLTIGLFIQPEVFNNIPDVFEYRGLMARFIYSFPHSYVGYRISTPDEITDEVNTKYNKNLKKLLELNIEENITFTLSKEASEMEIKNRDEIEIMLREEGELGGELLKEWVAKLAGQLIRICGLLHFAKHVNDSHIPRIIEEETMLSAFKLRDYLIAHAKFAHGVIGIDEYKGPKYLLGFFTNRGKETYSRREVQQATKGTLKKVEEFEAAIDELEARNYIRRTLTNTSGKGRQSYDILINPDILKT